MGSVQSRGGGRREGDIGNREGRREKEERNVSSRSTALVPPVFRPHRSHCPLPDSSQLEPTPHHDLLPTPRAINDQESSS